MAKILIVDDEASAREVIRESVSALGHHAEEASDGLEALERFRRDGFDVVITDLSMPNMDGIELTDRLHDMDPQLPVLMVTGRSSLDLRVMAWNRGIAEYLHKPFRLSSLRATLDQVMSARRQPTPPADVSEEPPAETGAMPGVLPYVLALGTVLVLVLLWLYWDHLLDLQALSHLMEPPTQ